MTVVWCQLTVEEVETAAGLVVADVLAVEGSLGFVCQLVKMAVVC